MMGQQTKEQPVTANRDVTDPAVQALIAAINNGDRAAFFARARPRRHHVGRWHRP